MIYLYLKTHNVTGLKYLGKTIKNPYEYKGSGVYWKNHLKKYGNDVTTQILFQSENFDDIVNEGIRLSIDYNIIDSSEFANLMIECGTGGVNNGSFKKGCLCINKGKKIPVLSEIKKKYWEEWKLKNPNYKDKWKKYIPKGKENWLRADNTTPLNMTLLECPHCKKISNVGNAKRWHFDKCKYKSDV